MAMPLSFEELMSSLDELLEAENVKEVSAGIILAETSPEAVTIRPRNEWDTAGRCSKTPVYFSGDQTPNTAKKAKLVCAKCNVVQDCLIWALLYDETGIWGGMTDSERGKTFSKEWLEALREKARSMNLLLEVPRSLSVLLARLHIGPGGQ